MTLSIYLFTFHANWCLSNTSLKAVTERKRAIVTDAVKLYEAWKLKSEQYNFIVCDFFWVCVVRVLCNGKKTPWWSTLLIVDWLWLLQSFSQAHMLVLVFVPLTFGWNETWRVVKGVGCEWPVHYPHEGIGFDTMTNTCVKSAWNVSLSDCCVSIRAQ